MVVDKAIGVLRMGITCCWELSVVTSVEVCLKNNTHTFAENYKLMAKISF